MNNNELKVLNYEGTGISFEKRNGEMMVNATEMARKYGKRVGDWFAIEATKTFMSALETTTNGCSLVETREGRKGGTWLHRNAALEFARWLNPLLAIWMNDAILKLMSEGHVELPLQPQSQPRQPEQITKLQMEYMAIQQMSMMFNISDVSKAALMNKVSSKYELEAHIDYLPAVDVAKSATELLKENNVDASARIFNQLMVKNGFLAENYRRTRNGSAKFYVLTQKGLVYGKNDVCPQNPNETQPHYYASKFRELLFKLGLNTGLLI